MRIDAMPSFLFLSPADRGSAVSMPTGAPVRGAEETAAALKTFAKTLFKEFQKKGYGENHFASFMAQILNSSCIEPSYEVLTADQMTFRDMVQPVMERLKQAGYSQMDLSFLAVEVMILGMDLYRLNNNIATSSASS